MLTDTRRGRYGTPAVGSSYSCPNGKRVVIGFPEDVFQDIRTLALRNNTSFAAQVRRLVEWGLLSVTEPGDLEMRWAVHDDPDDQLSK